MVQSLGEWLTANSLSEFEEVFAQNRVDLETLLVLTESDLKELGLPFGPRKRILNAIVELKTQTARRPRVETPRASSPSERRQLTVMFCDLVGSTALSAILDPEELNALIKSYRGACRKVISRYGGHVAQYLGDGLMIYFGWPIALEDAAERGGRSALGLIQAVKTMDSPRPLAVRISLATGPVVVGKDSPDGGAEAGLAVGEAPNMAARLLALASPGEIVIAASTRRLLGNTFSLTDLGLHSLKGIPEPVQAWRLDEARLGEGRFKAAHGESRIAPLVGREKEATFLERCWQQACGGAGRVVQIGGQPGIGKSRLTQELRQRISAPHAALHYQCSPYHLNSPLYPFIEELESSAGFVREDTPEQRLEKLEAALADLAPHMEDAVPLFTALLSLPAGRYPPPQLSPRKQKGKTLEALIDRVRALSRHGPLIIVIEDIHWIDPTSQDLLERLVPIVKSLPVLLVMTYRLEYQPPWTGPDVATLTLNRLDREHGAQLVESLTLARALPTDVLDEILARADGVPLFVEELTRSVLESGLLREEGDCYSLQRPLAALAIPASLRDSLMARLDRLGAVKELAQIGACIGREFSFELLQHIAALRADSLDSELEKLVDAGLVSRSGAPPDAVYLFKHALVQDAAYDSLLKSRRSELHARIARVLENDFADRVATRPEWLAYHHTQAGHITQAIPLWRRAGTLAVARVTLKEAVAHFMKGLGLIDQLAPSPERDDLELTIREPLNAAWTGLRGWAAPEVGVNATAILRLAERRGNRRDRLLAMWWVWTSTITQGRIADSQLWVDRLLAEGSEADDSDLKSFGHAAAMVQYFLNGRLTESREQANLALYELGSAEGWIQMTGHDLRTFVEVYACQLIWIMGYPDQAKKLSDECIVHARGNGHTFNLVWALTFSAYVFAYRREPDRLLDQVGEADRLAHEQSLTFIEEVSVPQVKGIAALQNQRPAEAIVLLRQGIERWTKTGGNVRIPLIKSALAVAVGLEGDTGTALKLIDECIAQIELPAGQERLWLPEVLRCKGWILMRDGREQEAETQWRASIDCARQQQARSWELRSSTALARLLASRGQRDAARSLLSPIYEWFTEGAETQDLVEAREVLESTASDTVHRQVCN
jgi:class 3 adenylate cyclase/tetratricopeptide (TPR) repeat protein